jgi:hypothetical protein
MAQSGIEDRPVVPDDVGAKLSGQSARQGQNIKGMLAVLVVGTLLVAGAFAAMLALQAQPSSVVNESRDAAVASEPVQQPLSTQPETAGSPN